VDSACRTWLRAEGLGFGVWRQGAGPARLDASPADPGRHDAHVHVAGAARPRLEVRSVLKAPGRKPLTMPELGRQQRYMGAAPNPRILTGWFGASSYGLRFPVRAFLRFPVCPPGLFPFVAFLRFPFARRSPVPSLRPPLSGSVPRRFPSGFPSP
jgi:hypothetical protein